MILEIIRKLNFPCMQKTALYLVALGCIVCFSPTDASAIAKVTALKSSAWVQRANGKAELRSGSDLEIGDHIITSDTGRAEMQLWSNASLRLYPNSEIKLLANNKTELNTPDNQPVLYVQKGRVCVDYKPQPNAGNTFLVNIGNTIVTAIHHHSYICLLRENGLSSIALHDGSVQVTHSSDPSMIILSKSGTELRINDEGTYEFKNMDAAASLKPESEEPFITGTDIEAESPVEIPASVESETAIAEETVTSEPKPTPAENRRNYIYTVYLFSTGSEDVANEVNQRFQKTGHKSEIIISGEGDSLRYRVAVSGFKSRQSAQEFSSAVVGKLGISDTWIGVEDHQAVTDEIVKNESKATTDENTPGYIYTVYLFSSGSEDVANEANQRFQKAGHKSAIIVSETDSSIRYRVAVSGFNSRQSAQEFSSSVVGKLGIMDTWIGRERQQN